MRLRCFLALVLGFSFSSCGAVKGVASGDLDSARKGLEVAQVVKEGIDNLQQEMTPENEYYVGRAVATNLLAKANYEYLDADSISSGEMKGLTEYVNHMAEVIVASAMERGRDDDRPAPLAGWHVLIIKDDTINATAAPGGFIFITTGAIRLAQNEDEIAGLIAHEVAHIVRGHALGTIKKSRTANVSKDLLTKTGALSGAEIAQLTTLLEGAIDDMIDGLLVKGYSKETEFEADSIGIDLAAAAGYDPRAMVAYLHRLSEEQNTGSGGFYSTHPSATERISKLSGKADGSKPSIARARVKRFRRIKSKAAL